MFAGGVTYHRSNGAYTRPTAAVAPAPAPAAMKTMPVKTSKESEDSSTDCGCGVDACCCCCPVPLCGCLDRRYQDHGCCLYSFCCCLCWVLLAAIIFLLLWLFGVIHGCQYRGWFGGPGCTSGSGIALLASSSTGSVPGGGSYAATVLADSPFVYLRLNDVGPVQGQAAPNYGSSGWPYAYSLVGAVLVPNAPPVLDLTGPGVDDSVVFSQGISLDSSSSETVGSVAYSPTSLEVWFRTSNYGNLITFEMTTANGLGYGNTVLNLEVETSGMLRFTINTGQVSAVCATDGTYNDGANHHVVATWEASDGYSLYVDGMTQASGVDNNPVAINAQYGNLAGTWYVAMCSICDSGGSGTGGIAIPYFDGNMGQYATYQNQALTLTQVRNHFVAGGGSSSFSTAPSTAPLSGGGGGGGSSSYQYAVVNDSAVFYWPLSGNYSVFNNTVVPLRNINDVRGQYPGLFNLSSANFTLKGALGGVTFKSPGTSLYLPQQWSQLWATTSFEAWVLPNATAGQGFRLMAYEPLFVGVSAAGAVTLGVSPTVNVSTVAGLVTDGNWHQVVATYSYGTGMWLWVDGALQVGLQPSQLPSVTSQAGRWVVRGTPGTSVKRVSVYATALNSTQVRNHWLSG